jgi:carboxyl-terminal processing protease
VIQIGDDNLQELGRGLTAAIKDPFERNQVLVDRITGRLEGWEGEKRNVRLLDEKDDALAVTLTLKRPRGIPSRFGELPTEYAVLESKELPGSIGYMGFNTFMIPLLDGIRKTMTTFCREKAMIIDLRGNLGGVGLMASAVAGRLVRSVLDMGVEISRTDEREQIAYPQEPRFDGPVAILVDENSASTSEELAVSLQEAKRAIVVGCRSRGALAAAAIVKLPDDSRLEYPASQYKTSKGVVVEGVGVRPDILVIITRRNLLAGKDPILDAAIEALRKKWVILDRGQRL